MKIAHISDLHADTTLSFQNRFRNLLQSIRDHHVEHLIITGDLTDKATHDEYDTVIRILNEYDFTSGKDLSVIPGNHDLFPSVYQTFTFRLSTLREEFRSDPIRITKELYRVMRAYRKFTPDEYRHALSEFLTRFQQTFDTAIAIGTSETEGFPYIKHLHDDYAAVCIESNYVSPHINTVLPYALLKYFITKDMYSVTDSPICSNGWVDTDLLKRALAHPEVKDKKLIVLLHHYVYTSEQERRYMNPSFARTMSLVNREALIDELSQSNAKLLLHGHWHVTEEYTVCDGNLRALNGAGVFFKKDGKWNLLTLGSDGVKREEITLF